MTNPSINVFSTRVKHLLDHRNITQKKLSKDLGSNYATINKYIIGANEPNYTMVASIAKLLNTSVAFLYGESDIIGAYTPGHEILFLMCDLSLNQQEKIKNVVRTMAVDYKLENNQGYKKYEVLEIYQKTSFPGY